MPQTVPNSPTNGAVEPTEARIASPDCSLAENSSMVLRRQRVMQVRLRIAMVRGGLPALQGQLAKGVVGSGTQFGQSRRKVFAVPEISRPDGEPLVLDDVQGFDDDDDP